MAPHRPTKKNVDYSATLPQRPSTSVVGTTVRLLRIAIMTGRFAPGQKLVEADLCRDFTVSRASLRETLRLLQAERLIEIAPHRGPSVVKLGRQDVADIHDIWSLLTSEAVYRFAGQATPHDTRELDVAIARLRAAVGRQDGLGQLAAINSFFGYILAGCGNQALVGTVSTLVSRVNFLRAQALHRPNVGAAVIGELEDIVASIADGNANAARRAAEAHIAAACTAAEEAMHVPVRYLGAVRKADADSLCHAGLPI